MSPKPLPLTPSYSFTVEELAFISAAIATAVSHIAAVGIDSEHCKCVFDNRDLSKPLMSKIHRAVSAALDA